MSQKELFFPFRPLVYLMLLLVAALMNFKNFYFGIFSVSNLQISHKILFFFMLILSRFRKSSRK